MYGKCLPDHNSHFRMILCSHDTLYEYYTYTLSPCALDLPEISVQRVPVLLYADDLALVATSGRGLQSQLDLQHAYADT